MKISKIKIIHFKLIWIFLFMLFFRPAFYVFGYRWYKFGNYLTEIIAFIMIFFAFFLFKYGYRFNKVIISVITLYFWCIIGSSFLNKEIGNEIDFSNAVLTFLSFLLFILMCDIGLWYSAQQTLQAFIIVGTIVCTINAITIFVYGYSGGMNHSLTMQYGRILTKNYFFLAEDNATYFWTWPVLVVIWFYFYRYKFSKRIKWIAIAYTTITILSYFYMKSMLALAASISVPMVLYFLDRNLKREIKKNTNKPKKNYFIYLWSSAIIFNYLLASQIILPNLQNIIVNIFHKDVTISYRTVIWERSLYYINTSPIIGFGNEPGELSVYKILINHTHNLVLETLYRGGFIGLILLIFVFIFLTKYSEDVNGLTIYKFLEIMVFVFLINSSVEFAYYRYHYLILFLLMAKPEIYSEYNKK